ncbi:hypothetical protein [Paractinoplanes abujensis]|uniref:DUF3558 domain-containing protein n=1 Tax=Paractinoplanes abujensis TaxID=882441 RepID=A0A7W7G3K0_9ACTN|nr:hypothetical protein [Actinoplanes abujensis]MBB4692831.1 hypothetical protein [Actinoplanes abujensis]
MNRRPWWSLPAIALLLSACGTGSGKAPAEAPVSLPAVSGKCSYVTVEEMLQATGLPAVKPVETTEGCGYLYDPAAVMPPFYTDIEAIDHYEPMPPAVVILYSDTAYSIEGTEKRIADPKLQPVPGVGQGAVWSEDAPERIHELDVRTAGGTLRIMLDQDAQLRTDDLKEIAVAIFRHAEPRIA